jgi:tetratricopeptide (TPR) repeat protein
LNISEFISLIEHPETPGKAHIPALKQIAAEFPYFQPAQVLLAKALYNERHYEFEKQLKYTALTVPDRAVLFRYIHNLNDIAEAPQKPAEPVVITIPEPVAENAAEEPVVISEGPPVPEMIHEEPVPAVEQTPEPETETVTIPEEPAPVADKIPMQENEPEPEINNMADEAENEHETPAEMQLPGIETELPEEITIPEESVAPVAENTPEEEPAGRILPVVDTAVPQEQTEEPVAEAEMLDETPETAESETVELSVDETEIHSFTEWLKLQQGKKIISRDPDPGNEAVAEPDKAVTPEVAAEKQQPEAIGDIVEDQDVEENIEIQETAELPEAKKSNIGDFESILDKFIRDNPRISRPKAEFYNPVNMAKQSVEQDDELVTETLANVYYKQGHYKKAIRAYEKLCLIYPHKMTYFASLIQKIKSENKD